MIERYRNAEIAKIFSDENKLDLWQKTEIAAMIALVHFEKMPQDNFYEVERILRETPIDIEWWKKRDKEIHHDLNAFIDERIRHLPTEYHQFFHKNMTSYDTEEPAFVTSLKNACVIILEQANSLSCIIRGLAEKYRYTIMNARTHGQEAEMQSFGARCLTWLADLNVAINALYAHSSENLLYCKLSGAIGKYGSMSPSFEEFVLNSLGLRPFYGATQIMPRILYAPIAQDLSNLVSVLDKTGHDIRLGARSGRPILQEPFNKKQKGSSAMPHKKNTIRTEQLEGMARLARSYASAIGENIKTWEERAIEQSCVERVAWPDLFHVTFQSLQVLQGVLKGLTVYQDNMLLEIYESRGVYASSEVKEFLKEILADEKMSHEDVYRIVQLACFNVFEPSADVMEIRETLPKSFSEAEQLLKMVAVQKRPTPISIEDYIPKAKLHCSEQLEIGPEKIKLYNKALQKIFNREDVKKRWHELFTPEFLLRNEEILFQQITCH